MPQSELLSEWLYDDDGPVAEITHKLYGGSYVVYWGQQYTANAGRLFQRLATADEIANFREAFDPMHECYYKTRYGAITPS